VVMQDCYCLIGITSESTLEQCFSDISSFFFEVLLCVMTIQS
jgi:hypothetical protein